MKSFRPVLVRLGRVVVRGRLGAAWSRFAVHPATFALLLIAVGAGLRLSQFYLDRSFYVDEAMIALNIADNGYRGLTGRLEFDQRAPIGFLWSVKWLTRRLGSSDEVLRIVPLASGLGALCLCPIFLRRWGADWVTSGVALLVFALAPTLIFYASELKQYSTDVFCSMLLWTAFAATARERVSRRSYALLAGAGAFTLWWSIPIVFVMAGLGLCFAGWHGWRRRWRELTWFTAVGVVWLISFAGVYWVQYRKLPIVSGVHFWWTHAFMPRPDLHGRLAVWFYDTFLGMGAAPIGLALPGLAALAIFFGAWSLWHTNRYGLAALGLPFLVLAGASAFWLYPFAGRVILFLVPALTFFLAACVSSLLRSSATRPVGIALAALILLQPAGLAARHALRRDYYVNPCIDKYQIEAMKPVLAHVRTHWKDGDSLYLYNAARIPFRVYGTRYGFDRQDAVEGVFGQNIPWSAIYADLARLRGQKRVWIVFTHTWRLSGVDDQLLYRSILDSLGRQLGRFDAGPQCDGTAYLYDLTAAPAAPPLKWLADGKPLPAAEAPSNP